MADEYIRKADAVGALADYIMDVNKVYSTGKLTQDDCIDCAESVLDDLSSADVAPVVRCVDCRRCSYDPLFNYFWCNLTLGTRRVKPDDFCSYGEKRGARAWECFINRSHLI